MNIKVSGHMVIGACIAVMLVVSAVLYPSLPEQLPRQWGFDGEVNTTWHKSIAVVAMPLLVVFLWGLTYILPKIDPRKESYEKFEGFYMRFRVGLVMFFTGMHIITLTQYDNPDALLKMIAVGVSALLILLGNEMGRVRQTWFFGLRTPWTLADERVWRKTHRVGGRWFVGLGFLNMVTAIFLPPPALWTIFIVSVLAVSLGLTGYSYVVHQRLNS